MVDSVERLRRGGKGHRIFQEIRPRAGFETGDFVEEILRGLPSLDRSLNSEWDFEGMHDNRHTRR